MGIRKLRRKGSFYHFFQVPIYAIFFLLCSLSDCLAQIDIKGIYVILPHEEKLEKGILRITSLPPEAKVYIDGNYEGKTPFEKTVIPGKYDVKVSKTNHGTRNRIINVAPGEVTSVKFRLLSRWAQIIIIQLATTLIATYYFFE